MRSKLLQVKLVLDMILICTVLFSDSPINLKIIVGMLGFDYTMMSSKRIEDEQIKEKK